MINFAYNLSSWNMETNTPIKGSMFDRVIEPIKAGLAGHGMQWMNSREPVDGQLNLYCSSRKAYETRVKPIDEVSVSINHGIADKGIRANLMGQFGFVVAPSERMAKTMMARGGNRRHVVTLGYPKLDPFFQGRVTVPDDRDGRIRVLYAPTQNGGTDLGNMEDSGPPSGSMQAPRTSWWRRDEVLPLLDPSIFDVVVCPHPRYAPGHQATFEQYVHADVVIADGGSTLWEAMALGIPLVIPRWITGDGLLGRKTMEGELYAKSVGRHADSPDELARLCHQAAEVGPGGLETDYGYIGLPEEFRGVSGQIHADWIMSVGGARLF